jgi:hypothetical protein
MHYKTWLHVQSVPGGVRYFWPAGPTADDLHIDATASTREVARALAQGQLLRELELRDARGEGPHHPAIVAPLSTADDIELVTVEHDCARQLPKP